MPFQLAFGWAKTSIAECRMQRMAQVVLGGILFGPDCLKIDVVGKGVTDAEVLVLGESRGWRAVNSGC